MDYEKRVDLTSAGANDGSACFDLLSELDQNLLAVCRWGHFTGR
jgi:hypothetical protein